MDYLEVAVVIIFSALGLAIYFSVAAELEYRKTQEKFKNIQRPL